MLILTNENSEIQVRSIDLHFFFLSPSYPFPTYDNAHFFTKGPYLRYSITSSEIKKKATWTTTCIHEIKDEMAELFTAVCNLSNQGWFRKISIELVFKLMDQKNQKKPQTNNMQHCVYLG